MRESSALARTLTDASLHIERKAFRPSSADLFQRLLIMRFLRSRSQILIYILHSGNLYGTERMALATLEGMNEYAVRIVVAPRPRAKPSVKAEAIAAGYQTVTFHTRWELFKGILPWFLRFKSIDTIGVGVGSSILCHVLARALGVRLRQLQVAHGGMIDSASFGRKHLLNRIPVVTVAVSEFVKTKLLAFKVRPDSIMVIENFLSSDQRREYKRRPPYYSAGRAARPLGAARTKVAIVSRVDEIKRIDVLLSAVENHGLAEFEFDIYGTGEKLIELRQRAAPLPNVSFKGYVEDVEDRLSEADLLLHLCPEEPFGLAILEAYASGVVVIVPNAGGAGSLVQPEITGFHFVANDSDDVARVLRAALATPAERLQAFVEAGATTLDGRFSQTAGVDRYRQALEAAAKARR